MRPFKLGRNVSPISHLFYADDMLIFTNRRMRSLRCLRVLMTQYEEASGQKINLDKSSFYASKTIRPSRLIQIQRTSGCQKKTLPFKYLGAPIYKGRCSAALFEDTFTKFTAKLEGWHSRYLSFGGKITLIRSVLASLRIHIFSCMAIPKQVLRRMEGLMGFVPVVSKRKS